MRIINWIRPTFEGADGKASYKRVTVFYFMILLTYMVWKAAHGSEFPDVAWVVVAGGAGLMSGLTTWQNISQGKNDSHTTTTI